MSEERVPRSIAIPILAGLAVCLILTAFFAIQFNQGFELVVVTASALAVTAWLLLRNTKTKKDSDDAGG